MTVFSKWWSLTGILLIFAVNYGHSQNNGPCETYDLIDMHVGRREITYQPTANDQLYCDSNVDPDKWVRFVRDGLSYQLANEGCIHINQCGTDGPLWMAERTKHPTRVGEEVEADACMNYGFLGTCCTIFGVITVRLCEDRVGDRYYVYKLPRPDGCYTGYCVDPVEGSCPPASKRGRDRKCIPPYPPQNQPTLEGPIIDGNIVKFSCAVAFAGAEDRLANAQFDVTFLFDGIADPKIPAISVEVGGKALLDEHHLKGHFGKAISCASTAYWKDDTNTKGDEVRSSNTYFIGVRADNHRFAISEADESPQEVVLRATLPLLCKGPNKDCQVCTRVVTEGMAVTGKQCEYCFKPKDWKPDEKKAFDLANPLRISAIKNQRLDEPKTYFIDFAPFFYQDGGADDQIWSGYEMHDIAVTYQDSTHGECSATGDPHITSFDGKFYHVYDIGQFLMWRSDAQRHFEVHARFWLCDVESQVSCICAVAVREGNVILGVDKCGSRSLTRISRLKIMKYSPSTWSVPTGAFVSSDQANTYYINMPSGAYVRVLDQWWGLDVYMHALAEDKQKSSGLCGNFDGNPQNDLMIKGTNELDKNNDEREPIPRRFSQSYRIQRGQSFFDSNPQRLNLPDPDVTKCRCEKGAIVCSPQADVDMAQKAKDKTVLLQINLKGVNNGGKRRRRKRDVDILSDNIDEEDDEFDYGEDFVPDTQFTWPTRSGITELQARDLCQSAFDGLPYKNDCMSKTNVNIEDSIRQCMEDTKITDNPAWAQSAVGTFEQACEFLILQDRNLYTEGPEGELKPPVEILGKICPNQCSGRGTCGDGVCDCNSGFTGVDCSMEDGAPPQLHYIPGPGRCDLTQRPCREFRLVASQFKNSDRLTCRVSELSSKATAGDVPVSYNSSITAVSEGTATFITPAEIACKVPDIASQDLAFYQVLFDFTYDGEKYSNQLTMTIFDGECLECDGDCSKQENWKMLPDSCIIDGRCVIAGDLYSYYGNCFTCDPAQSQDHWTKVPVENCVGEPDVTTPLLEAPTSTPTEAGDAKGEENEEDEVPIALIIGLLGAALLVVVVVGVLVACYRATRHTGKAYITEKNVYETSVRKNDTCTNKESKSAENEYQELRY